MRDPVAEYLGGLLILPDGSKHAPEGGGYYEP